MLREWRMKTVRSMTVAEHQSFARDMPADRCAITVDVSGQAIGLFVPLYTLEQEAQFEAAKSAAAGCIDRIERSDAHASSGAPG